MTENQLLDQLPVTVFDHHKHTSSRVDTRVIGCAHVVDRMGAIDVLGALQGVTQGLAELRSARFGFLCRFCHCAVGQEISVIRVGCEGIAASSSKSCLIDFGEVQGGLLGRIAVGQLLGDHDRSGRCKATFNVLATHTQEIFVDDAVVMVDLTQSAIVRLSQPANQNHH